MKALKHSLIAIAFMAGALLVIQGCEPNLGFVRSGSAVKFTVSSQSIETKTIYSGEFFPGENKFSYERIDWVEGDTIRVWSDKAYCAADPEKHIADYEVFDVVPDRRYSRAKIKNVASSGLVWGEEGKHSFLCVYPSPAVNPGAVMNTQGDGPLYEFSFTFPATQSFIREDLLTDGALSGRMLRPNMNYAYMYGGAVPSVDAGDDVELLFAPGFMAFQFIVDSADDPTMTLNSFTLSSASKALWGTCTIPVGVAPELPNPEFGEPVCPEPTDESQKSVTMTFGPDGVEIEQGTPVVFTVFVLPQAYNDLSISFETSAGRKTLDLKKDGSGYEFNRIQAKYIISLGGIPGALDYYFSELPAQVYVSHEGGLASIHNAFKSYRQRHADESQKEPVAYTVQYKEEGGEWQDEAPEWLTNAPVASEGSVTGEVITSIVNASYDMGNDPSHAAMENATGGGATASLATDLSLKNVATGQTVARTTANCYVVSAPGYYKFPLVYGNGVVNGQINTMAFTQEVILTDSEYLTTFKDHLNGDISTPYIASKYKGGLLTAEVLWTDAIDLVKDPTVSGYYEDAYITFRVPQDRICQGNALIALKIDGVIAWSWHIWVTNENLSGVAGPTGIKISPRNVGWVDGKTVDFLARQCTIKFVQDKSGYEREVVVFQDKYTATTLGNSPYFQWGRKDPLPASFGSRNDFKKYYGEYYVANSAAYNSSTTIGGAIQNPCSFYNPISTSVHNWCSVNYHNLWNTATVDVGHDSAEEAPAAIKTIYDPSPVGYMIPRASVFGYFSDYVFHPYFSSFSYTTGTSTNLGGVTADNFFFPFSGEISHKVGLSPYRPSDVNRVGHYWTIVPCESTESSTEGTIQAYYLSTNYINQVGSFYVTPSSRSIGNCVRPVEEERMLWFNIATGGQLSGGSFVPLDNWGHK